MIKGIKQTTLKHLLMEKDYFTYMFSSYPDQTSRTWEFWLHIEDVFHILDILIRMEYFLKIPHSLSKPTLHSKHNFPLKRLDIQNSRNCHVISHTYFKKSTSMVRFPFTIFSFCCVGKIKWTIADILYQQILGRSLKI